MNFPENILSSNERIERDLRPHWLVILPAILVGLLIIAVAGFIVWLTPVDPTWDIVDWVVIGLGIILLIVFVLIPFLRWRTTRYVITNRRVVVRRGILSKSGKDIALSKITDVSFRQSLLDRIIKSGTLHIESAGDGLDEDFKNLPRSNEIQQLINRLVEDDIDARGFYGGTGRQTRHEAGGHGREADPSTTGTGTWTGPEQTEQPQRWATQPEDGYGGPTYQPPPAGDERGWETPPR